MANLIASTLSFGGKYYKHQHCRLMIFLDDHSSLSPTSFPPEAIFSTLAKVDRQKFAISKCEDVRFHYKPGYKPYDLL